MWLDGLKFTEDGTLPGPVQRQRSLLQATSASVWPKASHPTPHPLLSCRLPHEAVGPGGQDMPALFTAVSLALRPGSAQSRCKVNACLRNVEEPEDCPLLPAPPLLLPLPLTTVQLPGPHYPWPGTSWTQERGRTFTGDKHFYYHDVWLQ